MNLTQTDIINHLDSASYHIWLVVNQAERSNIPWVKEDGKRIIKKIKSLMEAIEMYGLKEYGIEEK